MKKPSDLLDAVVQWLGLERFDFSSLRTFTDALGRDQLLEPGITGWAKATYMQHNAMMVRRHSPRPLLKSTRAALDAFYAAPNADPKGAVTRITCWVVYPAPRGRRLVLPSQVFN